MFDSTNAAECGKIGGLTTAVRHDARAINERARQAFHDSFIEAVDREYPGLPDAERFRRAEAARRLHYARLALKSAEARRSKSSRRRSFPTSGKGGVA